MDRLLEETTERLFADHVGKATLDAAENGEFPSELWSRFHAAGLHLAGSPGSDTGWPDLFGVLKVAGRHAAPLPLAEILLSEAILGAEDDSDHASDADAAIQPGFTTIATGGVAPWARAASRVVTVDGEVATDFAFQPNTNVAGEPRDEVTLRAAASVPVPEHLDELLALSRVALMAGALERILEISVEYALLRTQFGRPIAKFQAVQHNLAILAGEVAAATCAGECGDRRVRHGAVPGRSGGGEGARGRSGRHRRGNRPPGSRRDRFHARAQPAPLHAAAVGVARRARPRSGVAGSARATHRRRRRRSRLGVPR